MAKGRTDGADATKAIAGPAPDPGVGWQASLDQVRALADAAPVAVVAVDGEGRIRLVNARAEEMFGYGRYELAGSPIDSLLPERFREAHAGYWAGFFAQPFVRPMGLGRNLAARRKDGSEFAVDCGLSFIEAGGETLAVAFVTDVTERKQAEEALRFTQFAVDRAGVACFWIDQDARFVYVNEAACRNLGYTREELLAMTVHDIDPEFPVDVWPDHWKQIRRRGSFTCESHHRAKDGRVFPVEVTVNHLEFGGREYNCAFAVDITERKRAEQRLRDSEAKFRTLAAATPVAVAIVQGTSIVYANSAAATLLGCPLDELLARAPTDFIHPEYRELLKGRAATRLRAEDVPSRYEAKLLTKGGQERWVEVNSSLTEFEGKPAILGTAFGITERRQAEEEAAEFKAIADNANYGVAIADLAGNLTYVNGYFARVHGYEPGELVGRNLTVFHSEEQLEDVRRINEELQGQGSYSALEVWHSHRDGTAFPMLMNGMIIRDTGGKPQFMAATAINITDRKLAEQALRDSEAKFRGLAEAMPAPVVMIQGERFVYVNSAATALSGYSSDELLAMGLRDVLHSDDAALLEGQALARLRGERVPSRYEARLITKDGRELWIDIKASISEFQDRPAVLATIMDITERKRADEAVRESEALNRALLEAVPDMIFRVDREGRCLNFIPAEGQDPSAIAAGLVGQNVRDAMPPEAAGPMLGHIAAALDSGRTQTIEYALTIDGTPRSYEARIVRSGPDEVLAIVRNVTEQRQAEEAQRHAREDLEGRVERQMSKNNPYGLTFREFTVLHLVAEGKADKEVALELDIRTATAQKHISNILHKMNAASRTEAGVRAVREGLID